jgi:hypothetical protein
MTKSLMLLLTAIWLATVGFGVGVLTEYEYTPGKATSIPSEWPMQSKLQRTVGQPTLVMFAHPDCPCTRASIGEIAVLMTHCQNRVKAHVVFLDPKGSSENWLHTDLWRSAESIPGVVVQADEDGKEAANFQATTSGQVVLYDADGNLLFRGGITSSRGHYGDSAGLSDIIRLLHHEAASTQETPVFGCSLIDPKSNFSPGSTACSR